MTPDRDPRKHYRERGEAAKRSSVVLERRIQRFSALRTATFLLMAVPLLFLETSSRDLWPGLFALSAAGAIAFFAMVRRHRRTKGQLARERLRQALSREGVARLDRDWDALPAPPLRRAPEDHPSAADLDLVGPASLSHLLGRVTTAPGRAFLARLLLDPFAPLPSRGEELLAPSPGGGRQLAPVPTPEWRRTVGARQEALRALAPEASFREELEVLGREVRGRERPEDTRTFLEWARTPPLLDRDRRPLYLARALALFTPLTLAAWLLGWAPGLLPALGLLGALALHQRKAPDLHARFGAAEGGEGDLVRWSALLAHAETLPRGAPLLAELAGRLETPEPGAARALRRLLRITDTAAVRRSSLAHFPLVALFAWDFHVLAWLERWQARNGEAVEGWIQALGELEALASLAGLVHDHPDWTFPELIDDPAAGIQAKALGHPLLRPDVCVPNDVELPPPGRLLLVTGSNMAGKTTLLRALGANQVLALAGGPVAAAGFVTRPLLPWTAMRVQDSLTEGVSYFLAELQRLRRVVEAARRGPVLYLLDEILQGTNSAERRTSARIVLDHLLRTGSVGAITTHDLTLADTEELRVRSIDVHFREEVTEKDGRRALDFDYRLRPGPATSRNALLLLEMVGLGPEGPPRAGD